MTKKPILFISHKEIYSLPLHHQSIIPSVAARILKKKFHIPTDFNWDTFHSLPLHLEKERLISLKEIREEAIRLAENTAFAFDFQKKPLKRKVG